MTDWLTYIGNEGGLTYSSVSIEVKYSIVQHMRDELTSALFVCSIECTESILFGFLAIPYFLRRRILK